MNVIFVIIAINNSVGKVRVKALFLNFATELTERCLFLEGVDGFKGQKNLQNYKICQNSFIEGREPN